MALVVVVVVVEGQGRVVPKRDVFVGIGSPSLKSSLLMASPRSMMRRLRSFTCRVR